MTAPKAVRLFPTLLSTAFVLIMAAGPAAAQGDGSRSPTGSSSDRRTEKQAASEDGSERFRRLFAHWKTRQRPNSGNRFNVSQPLTRAERRRLSSAFGMRRHPILGGVHFHAGVDLPDAAGNPVHATADGTVATAQWVGGYGLLVTLRHGSGVETRYGHLSSLKVSAGQSVRKGDIVGHIGSTGRATGPHLHYEVRIRGEAVDPLPYMSASRGKALSQR